MIADERIDHELHIHGFGLPKPTGHMLARLELSSAHAIDAFVVATALQFDTAVIATADPKMSSSFIQRDVTDHVSSPTEACHV